MSKTAHPRFFHLRYQTEFDDQMIAAVMKGYREWIAWVEKTLSEWETDASHSMLPKPSYHISEPYLSDDGRTITIRLEGDPLTYGALKVFEDGVPPPLYWHIPLARRVGLQVAYENKDFEELGRPAVRWHVPDLQE